MAMKKPLKTESPKFQQIVANALKDAAGRRPEVISGEAMDCVSSSQQPIVIVVLDGF